MLVVVLFYAKQEVFIEKCDTQVMESYSLRKEASLWAGGGWTESISVSLARQ